MENAAQNMDVSNDLLKQISETQKKEIRLARIRLILSAACVLLLVIALITLLMTVQYVQTQVDTAIGTLKETAGNVNEIAENLKKIDFASLEQAYRSLADVGTETMTAFQEEVKGIGDLSEQAEKILEDTGSALEKLNSVNVDSLNEGIKRLNDVLEPLSNFFSAFGGR